MVIGVVKEIMNHEYRVGLTPSNVKVLIKCNHKVLIESGAGLGVNFLDDDYINAGATILNTSEEVYNISDMIVKVKEPLESEYCFLKENQILFTYLHLAANPKLVDVLIKKNITAIAYETITDKNGGLPCLTPMSQIAGRLSIQEGAKFLEKSHGGSGVLLGGIPGVRRGKIVIVGGGVAGTYATKAAIGIGSHVTVLDINQNRLNYLDDIFGTSIDTLYSSEENLLKCLSEADLVIASVLIPGGRAPKIIKKEYLKVMRPGSVIVDIAIDQGGCCETSHITTHDDPVYMVDGILHYCVGNMPGAVPYTSTIALTNVTIKYALLIANYGVEKAIEMHSGIRNGLNIYNGEITNINLKNSLME